MSNSTYDLNDIFLRENIVYYTPKSLAANSSEPYLWNYLFPNSHYSLEKLSLMTHNDSKKTRRIRILVNLTQLI